MKSIQPQTDRVRAHFRESQHVRAEPATIFPLLCPVREFDWILTWDCEIVYTETGLAEEGCVFQTGMPRESSVRELQSAGGTDTWVISRYLPAKGISFIRVNPLRTIRYDIGLESDGEGATTLTWEQEVTALNEEGDRHVRALRQEDFTIQIKTVEKMLQHYLETGEALKIDY